MREGFAQECDVLERDTDVRRELLIICSSMFHKASTILKSTQNDDKGVFLRKVLKKNRSRFSVF